MTNRSEKEINESVQLILDSAPMSITVYNTNRVMIDCNIEAVNMFGLGSKEEFIDTFNGRFYTFFPEYQYCGTPTLEKVNWIFETAMKDSRVQLEWNHLTADGQDLPTELTLVRVDNHGVTQFVAYVRDLRKIKEAEKNAVLDQQRTVAAEEESREKTRFLARMSHEIRTPLTSIVGISELELRNQVMSPHTEEAFAKIFSSSKTLLNIVNDILDFSKMEAGKMPLINNEYDVASLVSDAGQLHLVYLDNKDIKFRMMVDENIPVKLIGDALRIRQVVNNLLTNAFKYTEVGTVVLSLECERKACECATLIISVKDTGIGMTREQIEEIEGLNSEYIRLHEQEKPFVSGTGLGLPIVYSLVQMMGAQISLQSEHGKGTHITLRIPQKISGTDVLGLELSRSLENFKSTIWSVTKTFEFVPEPMPYGKVLVVDDVDSNLYVAEAMLESFELTVELCESGQDTIDKVRQGNVYDIIFMDHMMPGIDGIETTKILRDMGYDHPIVALTANALKGQAELFMENGFSGFMSKPIDINRLNSYLVRFIKDKHEKS
ncbi:MAG: ATP-binding protein [Defluviitaleaceae bacterium]|nr:ATP-binding protein [Defluviitaleaceae bacterium]MCL2264032.1 ATP-binding protein [Defluviitaleaceae bacterium]